jgi:peroxiredoxin Q/BCP
MMTATEGGKAPTFTLPRDGGGEVSLSDYSGETVILYFYPRDDTPGCTIEAIDFTAMGEEFAAADATVIGVSKDSVAKHDKFIAKHNLGVILASDENGTACEDYGVWVEKNMYGKKSMGIERATFWIDGNGAIKQAWRKVKAKGHAEAVLDAVRAG